MSAKPDPVVTGPVAVVMSRFPVVTETFILRELDELERQGVPVVLVPLLREHPPIVHPQAVPWVERALYTPFVDARIARDAGRALLRRPARVLGLLARLLAESASSLNAFTGVLGVFPKSVSLGRRLRDLGVRHVHAHFATHPALAALVMSRSGRDSLPYSVTAHAHDIFVTHAGLETKVRRAAFVRCISEFNVRYLQSVLGHDAAPASKLPVIHCGIEPERHAVPAPRLRADSGALHLLCVAALKPYKGVRHLVDAVRLAREAGLDAGASVIGAGPLREELEARIRDAGLQEHVRLLGPRTQDEVAQELARCDAFVLPSVIASDGQMEGIPVALMEALASEVPVVASRISGIPELVRDGDTGWLVEPGDAPGLARAFAEIAADPAAARARAARGRELVASEFELRGVVRRLARTLDGAGARIDDAALRDMALAAGRIAAPFGAERIGVVRWSPGADARAAELLVPRPDAAPLRVVAKQHVEREGASAPARERARREHAALVALSAEGLAVPRALGLDEERALVVMERARGMGAHEAIRRARRDPEDALKVAGAAWFWLNQLRSAQGPARDERAFEPAAVLARLRRDVREDAARCLERGLPRRLVERLATRCERELTDGVPHETCWTHGDFWPGNVLVDTRDGWEVARITVLDLEGLQPGLPMEDAANFLEHVALTLPSLLSASRWDRAREAIESVMLVGHDGRATIPQVLRIAKALRLASRSPALAVRSGWKRRALRWRVACRLLELAS